jgi:hypothetical protein
MTRFSASNPARSHGQNLYSPQEPLLDTNRILDVSGRNNRNVSEVNPVPHLGFDIHVASKVNISAT